MKQFFPLQFPSFAKIVFYCFLLLFAYPVTAQWAREAGDNNRFTWAQGVSIDHHHNEIVSGFQNDSTHFGNIILPFNYDFDSYLAKYDSSGNLLWAQCISGDGDDKAYHTAIDENDNIYLVGGFTSSHLYLTAGDSIAVTATGNQNFFLAKYDKDGNFIWAKQGGQTESGSYACYAKGVAVDPNGNVVIGGYYTGDLVIVGTTAVLPGNGSTVSLFTLKFDENGVLLWSHNFSTASNAEINAVACDTAGNVFTTGKISGNLEYGVDTVAPIQYGDHAFLNKFSAAGIFQWIDTLGKSIQESSTDNNISCGNALAIDVAGDIYLGGNLLDTFVLIYDTVQQTYIPITYQDGFIAKYTNDGAQTWMQRYGNTEAFQSGVLQSDQVNGVALDSQGDLYAVGDYFGTVTFAGVTLPPPAIGTGFVGKFNPSNGTALWFITGGGLMANQSLHIAVDQALGNIAISGTFEGRVTFDTISVASTSTALSYQDIYLVRISNYVPAQIQTAIAATQQTSVMLYPNPAKDYVTLSSDAFANDKIFAKVYDATGKMINVPYTQFGNTVHFNLQSLAAGCYVVELNFNNQIAHSRFVKVGVDKKLIRSALQAF